MAPAEATGHIEAASSPVHGDEPEKLEPGIALCLSGGGYRAMLFHIGAIWRLNELGYLPKLNRISSVSGGSITNGVLAMNWAKLRYDDGVATNLEELLVQPMRKLAAKTIDKGAVFKGILLPGTISDRVAAAYREHLFGNTGAAGLPDRAALRLQRDEHADGVALALLEAVHGRLQGRDCIRTRRSTLAIAVAASSAFPPILSPRRARHRARALGTPQRTGRCTIRHTRRSRC